MRWTPLLLLSSSVDRSRWNYAPGVSPQQSSPAVCNNENKIALEMTFLNVPHQQCKEQSALNTSCLHFRVIIPIFFGRLAETNSAHWIFVLQKERKTARDNEADEH